MIKIILLVLIAAVLPATAAPFLAHSKAVVAGQSGDHGSAQKLLQDAIVAKPHDAALLYDAGVSEFKCGNYTNAVNYFEKAAQHAEKQVFQHEALFNAGNAHTHLKEYDAALQSYEKILADDATHERAKHNYEVVKKLKEQEEEQQQNQDQDKKQDKQDQDDQDDQDKDQQDGSDKQDKDNQKSNDDQSEGDDRSEENNQSGDGDNGEDSDQKDGNEEKQQQQNRQGNKDNDSSEQNKQQQQKGGDKQQKEAPTHGDKPSDTQEREYNNQREQSGNTHNKPSEKAEKKESTKAQSSNSATGAQPSPNPEQPQIPEALAGPDKQWMRGALEACEKQDTTHNKQLLKAVVGADKGDRRAVRSSW